MSWYEDSRRYDMEHEISNLKSEIDRYSQDAESLRYRIQELEEENVRLHQQVLMLRSEIDELLCQIEYIESESEDE